MMGKPCYPAPLALSQWDFRLLTGCSPGSTEPSYDSKCSHPPWGEATHLIREECWPCGRCFALPFAQLATPRSR